ncbi:MAG: hypothetical protein ACP5SI_08605 [Chloroflexia bacterium]
MAKRALVVAARDGMAPSLQTQVELWGGAVDWTVATSANEALWEVRGSPYDLVLAPWQLPEMTGIEFAEVVLALSPGTRVVLVGVPVTPALRNQAQALGVFGLLPDAEPQQVAALISRALELPIPQPPPSTIPVPGKPPSPPGTGRQPSASAGATVPSSARQALRPVPAKPPEVDSARPAVSAETRSPITWTPEQRERVRRALQELLASIGPLLALLVDAQGKILMHEGPVQVPEADGLAAQAVRVLAARESMAPLLGDEHPMGFLFFTGARYDLYAFPVTEATVLLLVFDRVLGEGKLGPVWLYARRSVEELRGALSP